MFVCTSGVLGRPAKGPEVWSYISGVQRPFFPGLGVECRRPESSLCQEGASGSWAPGTEATTGKHKLPLGSIQ